MLDFLRTRTGKLLVSAHRGASGYAPENTMPSFIKAVETGSDIIEFDVQRTRDGQCVIMHDDKVERTTNGSGYVWEHSWAELSRLDAGSWFDAKNVEKRQLQEANPKRNYPPITEELFAGTPVPRLEEVIEWAKSINLPVAIELKTPLPLYEEWTVYDNLLEQVLEIVARYGDESMSEIHSFDHRICLRSKQLNPNITTNVSSIGAILLDPLYPVKISQADGTSVAAMWTTKELIDLHHAENLFYFAWGVGEDPFNEESQLATLVKLGVDFVSGGYPDLLRQVVEKYI